MKKFDYYYARGVGKFLNATECLMKTIVPTKGKGVVKKLNISYGSQKGQVMDIFYTPSTASKKRPIFFYIHGGGFVSGKTLMRRPYCVNLAKQGFFVVNLDYRPAPIAHFPNQFNDIFNVVDYIFDRAYEYNLDTSNIVVGGESAGAYFSVYLSAMVCDKNLIFKNNIDFRHINEFNVSATVLINGAYVAEDIIKTKSPFCKTFIKAFLDLERVDLKDSAKFEQKDFCPFKYIDSNFPPTIVIRGKYDVFDKGSAKIIQVLENKNIKHSVFVAKGFAGLHAVTVAPIFRYSKKAFAFTMDKLKEYLDI